LVAQFDKNKRSWHSPHYSTVLFRGSLNDLLENNPHIRYVILEQYHSGTAPLGVQEGLVATLGRNRGLKGFFRAQPERMFFLCSFPAQLLKVPYANTIALIEAGGWVMKDWQPHELYTFLILNLSMHKSKREILHALSPWFMRSATGATSD
jgi:hypothetical protein